MTTIDFHSLDSGETLSRRIILFQLLVFLPPMPRKPYTLATSGKVSAANAVASTVQLVRGGWAFWRQTWKQGHTLM